MAKDGYENLTVATDTKDLIFKIKDYLENKNIEHTGVGKVKPNDVVKMLAEKYIQEEMINA